MKPRMRRFLKWLLVGISALLLLPLSLGLLMIAVSGGVSVEGNQLLDEGDAAYKQGQMARAATLLEGARAAYSRDLGPTHFQTISATNNLALSYFSLGRNHEAAALFEQCYALLRRERGEDALPTLMVKANLADLYFTDGRFTQAARLQEEVFGARRTKLGADAPDTLESMISLGTSYRQLGRHTDALDLYQKSLALSNKALGPEHHITLKSMLGLANSYSDFGRYAEALELNKKTFLSMRKVLGKEDPETLSSMNNLGNNYHFLGQYADALGLLEEALTLRRRRLGDGDFDTLASMINLSVVYNDLGRPAEALALNSEAHRIMVRKFGPDAPGTLISMSNIAESYRGLGKYKEALAVDEALVKISRKKLGSKDRATLAGLAHLAVDYVYTGDFTRAVRLGEILVVSMREVFGADHPVTLSGMSNLAISYRALGRYDDELILDQETLRVRLNKLGPDHPFTLASMSNLADVYYVMHRYAEAAALRRQELDVIDRVGTSLQALPRDERSTALAGYRMFYAGFAHDLARQSGNDAEVLSVIERGKARNLLEDLTALQAIKNSGIPEAAAGRLNDLRVLREAAEGKLAAAGNDASRDSLRVQLDTVRGKMEALHKDLMARYPRYAALSAVKTVTLEQGRSILPRHGVFLSWLFDSKTEGVALALPKTGKLRVIVSRPGMQLGAHAEAYRWLHALPDAASFAEAVRTVPLAVWQKDQVLYLGTWGTQPPDAKRVSEDQYMALRRRSIAFHGKWLSNALLQPLSDQVAPASQLIISPDGVLATIPWDTLPWRGSPLGQHKEITVIQSLSVYKLLKDREAEHDRTPDPTPDALHPMLVMGGAKYGTGTGKRSFQRAPQVLMEGMTISGSQYQKQSAYAYMRSRHWPNLAGSLKEADAVSNLMGGRKFTGLEASEHTLRELSQSGQLAMYRRVHLAAHGYLDTTVPSLSAVVLAPTGDSENEDGYITAAEWPGFRLNSDLLVMSACETGLGKIVMGEGVLGLPYALYVAGNRDTLLSLWQVSDDGTAVFMTRFWQKVKAGQSHARALSQTKREFQRGDAGKNYADPYYWAPFVLYGVQE